MKMKQSDYEMKTLKCKLESKGDFYDVERKHK